MAYTLIRDITKVNRTVMSNKKNEYIVIHYTGNQTDTAKANANYFRDVNRNASAAYFVDKTTVYQVVEDKDAGWSVGRNFGSNNLFNVVKNTNSISIEMCSDNGAIADETFANTVALTKELMKKYGIPADHVVRHFDVCSKNCPGWYGWGEQTGSTHLWDKFKAEISATETVEHLYRVRKTWSDAASQIGAYKVLEYAKEACKEGYSVFDENGNVVYTKASTPVVEAPKPTPAPTPAPKPVDTNVSVYYRVRVNGKWLPEVANLSDYAGIENQKITDVAIRVTKGSVRYRVHVLGGGWLGYITECDINNGNKYAGNGKPIDAIEVYYTTPSDIVKAAGYKKAEYRVSTTASTSYYSWQDDNVVDKAKGMDGYAGCFGRAIDKLQIVIK